MSEKVKGNSKRLISVPGYHIHPKYDLKHLRALIHSRYHKKKSFVLSLAPMVDMFSVLVIYLLMNFSSTGEVFFIGKDIELPMSSTGSPLKSFPLISVVDDLIFFEIKDPKTNKVASYKEKASKNFIVLRQVLTKYQKIAKQINPKKEFLGQINLQADYGTKLKIVKKVMQVLIEEGWAGINFVVEPDPDK